MLVEWGAAGGAGGAQWGLCQVTQGRSRTQGYELAGEAGTCPSVGAPPAFPLKSPGPGGGADTQLGARALAAREGEAAESRCQQSPRPSGP